MVSLNYTPGLLRAHTFVGSVGRQKYILPVYQNLVKAGMRDLAYKWFLENQNFYHPLTLKKVRTIILSSQ